MKRIFAIILTISIALGMVGNTAFAAEVFPDAKGHWAEDTINSLYEQGVIKGYPDGTVRPDGIITRAEFVSLITHSMKPESYEQEQTTLYFTDIDGHWAENYINTLAENKVIDPNDYTNKKYNPDEPITRMEIIKMVINSLGLQAEATEQETSYNDDDLLSELDRGYVNLADEYSITFGYPDNTMKPTGKSTRAEAFTLLVRRDSTLEKIENENESALMSIPSNGGSTGSGGGGGRYYPKAEVEFELPDYAHTDETITIETVNKNVKTLVWQTEKWNDETGKFEITEFEHTLTADGGNILFAEDGKYQLTAIATNMGNSLYKFSKQITVFPVAEFSILLSNSTTHTDTLTDISLELAQNIDNYDVSWSVTKDGETADYAGELNKSGGSILLSEKGCYTVTAFLTDLVGRTFENTAVITIYPLPEIGVIVPVYAYTGEEITITTEMYEFDEFLIDWTVTKDGEPIEYAGQLTNDGGRITISDKGDYIITASVTDETGRTFKYSQSVRIYAIPKVEFGTFGLPYYAHTDTEITIAPELTEIGDLTIDWLISKDNGTAKPYTDYTDGTLNNDGGVIRFTDKGSYKLTAQITDEVGEVYTFTSQTTIYPIPVAVFKLPETTHTDKTVTVTPETEELGNLDIIWNISKNGGMAANYTNYVAVTLNNGGGEIQFADKGDYILCATIIDEVGRVFEYSEPTKVYPVPIVDFTTNDGAEFGLPRYSYTDKTITVIPKTTELGNLNIVWTMSKGSSSPHSYTTYVQGDLSNEGGNISFYNTGDYSLIATITDEIGRIFEYASPIIILPIGAVNFDIASASYVDEIVTITASGEFDSTQWTIAKDSGAQASYSIYANGALTSTGGNISFTAKGNYIIAMTATDTGGRKYTASKSIRVYPTPKVSVDLPGSAYIGDTVIIETVLTDMDNLTASWYISKNGESPKDYLTYTNGSLSNSGGSLEFTGEGEYTLIAMVTDELGKTFEYASEVINVYLIPTIEFTLPSHAHTDTAIEIDTNIANIDDGNVAWTISKDGGTFEDYTVYANGGMSNSGGIIMFNSSGDYTLRAVLTDEDSVKEVIASKNIKIYDVVDLILSVPENGYTDTAVKIITNITNTDDLIVDWTISKDGGTAMIYTTYASGTLSNSGGNISFASGGSYTLTVTSTDATGRKFTDSKNIEIYNNASVNLTAPTTGHTDTAVEIIAVVANAESVAWTISKDGGASQNYISYVTGTLASDGGNIVFSDKGTYIITATVTDRTGKKTESSKTIIIYPVQTISYTLPATAYTDASFSVATSLTNVSGTIAWTLSKDGGEAASYTTYIIGSLSNSGGSIWFTSSGSYTLIASVTDATGRKFTASKSIEIYNNASVSLTAPTTGHTDTAVKIIADIANAESISWMIAKDGGASQSYISYVTGTLASDGGNIVFNDKGTYIITATVTDRTGKKTESSKTIIIYPVQTISYTLPATAYTDAGFSVATTLTNVSGTIAWTVSKDGGAVVSYTTYISGSLSNSGGSIRFTSSGSYTLIASVTDTTGRKFEYSQSITVYPIPSVSVSLSSSYYVGQLITINTNPVNLGSLAAQWSLVKDGANVNLNDYTANSLTNNGGNVTFNTAGSYTLTATITNELNRVFTYSATTTILQNNPPTTPVITRTPNTNSVSPGTPVTITALSTDPDGHSVTYVWEGRPAQSSTYTLGKNVVKVKAVDIYGAESAWTAIAFFVSDGTVGGAMLADSDSTIIEEGIEGATITSYTFTVPAVSAHIGSDYGRVRGFNVYTGEWEQIDYQTTMNGITMTGTLEPGKYSMLEFYYYTKHCMYGVSNITYSVEYYFDYGTE